MEQTREEKEHLLALLLEKKKRSAKQNLYSFTRFTKKNFVTNWFHEKYYEKLDEFRRGDIKKLMVFVPPQHGKSEGSTRRLPAMLIGERPDLKIGVASYSATKARKFGREIKRVIQSPEYKELYPKVSLTEGRVEGYQNAANEFEIPGYEGSIKLDGYNGAWTGDPIDLFILDDLYKSRSEALSEATNGSVISFWNSVAETRLHNESQVLIVFTRWAPDDLAGYLLEHEADQWEVVRYPALKEGEPTEEDPREHGEALLPFKHSKERLERIKARDTELFDSVYQQDPKPLKGLLFPKTLLKTFKPSDLSGLTPEYRYAAVDPADTGGDDTSVPFGDLYGNSVYISSVIYNNEGTDVTIPNIVERVVMNRLNYVEIEGVSAWILFAKDVRNKVNARHPNCTVRAVKNQTNKEVRIFERSAWIINHCRFLEEEYQDADYKKFMKVFTNYLRKGSPKNDAPDSLAILSAFFEKTFPHLF